MKEIFASTIEIFRLYSGNLTFMILFAASLVYLWIFEKDKIKKAVLVFSTTIFVLLFFVPFFADLFMVKLGEADTYYRFIWLFPSTVISSYAIFHFISRFKSRFCRAGLLAVVIVCILYGGVFMYENPVLFKAENPYEIPQCVIDICDDIVIEGREVEAVFPDEILQYVRQYTSYVVMPYGFEKLQFGNGLNERIHDIMVLEDIDVQTLCALCEEEHVHYIVLNKNRRLSADPADYNYEFVGQYGDYLLYKNTWMYYGRWEDYEEWAKEHGNIW